MPDEAELHDLVVGVTGATSTPCPPDRAASAASAAARTQLGLDHPIISRAPLAVYVVDLEGRVISWNRAAEMLFGWPATAVLGREIPIIPPEALDDTLAGLRQLLAGKVFEGIEATLLHRSGARVHVIVSSSVISDELGPAGVITFAVDVTDAREASARIRANEAKWRTLFTNISDAVTVTDAEGRVRQSTGEFADILGHPLDAWSDMNVFDLIRPDELEEAHRQFDLVLSNPTQAFQAEFRMLDQNTSTWETIEVSALNALAVPEVAGIVFTTRNVTERRAAESLLAHETELLELVARDAPLDTTLQAVAEMIACHATGDLVIIGPYDRWSGAELGTPRIFAAPQDDLPDQYRHAVARAGHQRFYHQGASAEPAVGLDLAAPGTPEASRILVDAGYVSATVFPIVEAGEEEALGSITICSRASRAPTPHVMHVLSAAAQISAIAVDRARALHELTHQAMHDQLTGLPNRRMVMQHLDAAMHDPQQTRHVGVMLLDLDRFKVVNDSLGHAVGDRLLVAFAERLRAIVRPGDTVGRFEGDEFVVVLPDIDDVSDVRSIVNRLDLALSEPFVTEHGDLVIAASVGTAISTGAETPEDLVKHADTACSRAKDLGGDRLELFDDELRARAERRLHLERDLRAAIERTELVVHYQPEIDLRTGTITGAEALLRWQHPERGLVFPTEFIGLSEETGLITRIGRWVLIEAVHQARTLSDRFQRSPLIVSVNLSARQLTTPNFVQSVETVLRSYDWPPERLQLELTESLLIDDTDARLEILSDLHALGVQLAIDDFGTGFSSLSYLERFPVDVVKLDRSFVEPLRADGTGSSVAKAVVHLAHDLGLTVTAEGVETAEQLAGLRVLGCDWAQGFHIARALPSEDLVALLETDPAW